MSAVRIDLESLLMVWRERRDPALVPLVTLLGEKAAIDETTAFDGLKPVALGNALVDALPRMTAEKLHAFLPIVERFVRTSRGSWPVIELLADLPPDPRVSRLALSILRDYDDLPNKSHKLWRRLVDLVETHGDPEVGAMILWMPAVATEGPTARERLENVSKRLAKKSSRLSPQELAELHAAVETFAPKSMPAHPTGVDGAALLAAIYDDPNDDAARLVYADWLSSKSDPRGEFIVLQFQRADGTISSDGKKREAALLKQHFRDWLGPLEPVLIPHAKGIDTLEPGEISVPVDGYAHTTFRKGFLSRLNPVARKSHRRAAFEDPIWSTVGRVTKIQAFSRAMSSLRYVDECRPIALESLEQLPNPLERLRVNARFDVDTEPPSEFRGSVKHATVAVTADQGRVFTWLAALLQASPILESLRIDGPSSADWRSNWSWSLLDEAPASFTRLEVCFELEESLLELRRGAAAWDVVEIQLRPDFDLDGWVEALDPFLERPAASLTVETPAGAKRGAIEGVMKRFARSVEVRAPAGA